MTDSTHVHDENEHMDAVPPNVNTPETPPEPADAGLFVSKTEFDAAQAQATQYLESWKRERADFDNYKRRIERERKTEREHAAVETLLALIPVIDDFERAMQNVPADINGNPWVNGVGMMLKKLHKLLDEQRVTLIDPTGAPFDPNLHEAIGIDADTEADSGTVTVTMQKGYLLGDRVLRPALVRVAG